MLKPNAKHKYAVGETLTTCGCRVKVISLRQWWSSSLQEFLPKYEVAPYFGNTDKIAPNSEWEVHEHELSRL